MNRNQDNDVDSPTAAQRAAMDEEGARTRAEMDKADDDYEAGLDHNRGVNDELRKLRIRAEARRQFDAEQNADRPQVQAVDGASFLLNQPDTVPCIWGTGSDVLWAEGEPLMFCGLAGVGKTTIAGQVLRPPRHR